MRDPLRLLARHEVAAEADRGNAEERQANDIVRTLDEDEAESLEFFLHTFGTELVLTKQLRPAVEAADEVELLGLGVFSFRLVPLLFLRFIIGIPPEPGENIAVSVQVRVGDFPAHRPAGL